MSNNVKAGKKTEPHDSEVGKFKLWIWHKRGVTATARSYLQLENRNEHMV